MCHQIYQVCRSLLLPYSVEFNERILSHCMGFDTLECVRTWVYYTICKLLSSGFVLFSESLVGPNVVLCRKRMEEIQWMNRCLWEHSGVESTPDLAKTLFYSSMRPLNSASCLEQGRSLIHFFWMKDIPWLSVWSSWNKVCDSWQSNQKYMDIILHEISQM